jgi:general secretion pathway protein I
MDTCVLWCTSTLVEEVTLKRHWWQPAEGFTLLEVMVALALIAVALVAFLHSQHRSIALLNESVNMTTATLLAQNRMIVLEHHEGLQLVEQEGIFEDPQYAGFRWTERLMAIPFKDLLEAHVEVSWDDGRGRRSVALVSLVKRR